jgi:hypothetical protein
VEIATTIPNDAAANTALGANAMSTVTTGQMNTAMGFFVMNQVTT